MFGQDVAMKCPKCGSNMIGVCYESSLKILQERSWNTCTQCGHEIDIAKWKRQVLSV